MKILLLLLLLLQDNTVDKLLQNLGDNDPVVRQAATQLLIEQEKELDRFRALLSDTSDLEVKWRLSKIIQSIENNQKFRSMTAISPLITLKFEGSIGNLFIKLATMTGQTFDARAFGDNEVKIDCVDTPLFKVLDAACKQVGYDWEVVYRNHLNDVLDQFAIGPMNNYTASINLCGLGMSSRTPNYAGSGFKMQVAQTSLSTVNTFGEVITEMCIQFKYAQDPGLKFAIGPKITYTKIVSDDGTELSNRSSSPRFILARTSPTTKNVTIKGKATYRIPIKIETIILKGIDALKYSSESATAMEFEDHPDMAVVWEVNRAISVFARGPDNVMKERFVGKYSILKKNGNVALDNNDGSNNGGYISLYDDKFEIYIYGSTYNYLTGGDVLDVIKFDYITEFRDISFDFNIDNIPLY